MANQGSSNEPNGPNETFEKAIRDAGLNQQERREIHREIGKQGGAQDGYWEIREAAEEKRRER